MTSNTIKFRLIKDNRNLGHFDLTSLVINVSNYYLDVNTGKLDPKLIFNRFSGFTDVCDNEIYEGDILTHKTKHGQYRTGEIIYSEEYATFLIKFWEGNEYMSDYLCGIHNRKEELVIIGNIYENAHLLNKVENKPKL